MRNENFLPVIFSEASVRGTNRPVRVIGPRAFAAVRHGIRSGKRDPRVSAAGRPTRQDKTGLDKTGQDWTKQNKTGQGKARQGKARQDKARQGKTRRNTTRTRQLRNQTARSALPLLARFVRIRYLRPLPAAPSRQKRMKFAFTPDFPYL